MLTPNPFSSGAAKWNLLAAYGQASHGGKDPQAGLDYVKKLLTKHVKVQDKSGREALQNFISGNADVLLSYEYEAVTANKKGEELDYVLPDDTIKINIDIAHDDDAPRRGDKFLDYVLSKPAQETLRRLGLPPGQRGGPRGEQGQVPRPAGPLHDRRPRRLEEGQRRALRRRGRRDRQDRGGGGGLDRQVSTVARHPAERARPPGRARSRSGLDAVAQHHRAAAARGPRRRARLDGGFDTFWDAVIEPPGGRGAALHDAASRWSRRRSTSSAGTLIAWVLVRDRFPGKRVVNALIDLPFALPTIVAGLTLLALYGPAARSGIDIAYTQAAVLLALLFVTLPFVVRSVQPVLMELDREMEEAALSLGANSRTIFRRIMLPEPRAGDPAAAPRSPSRARSASSARSS